MSQLPSLRGEIGWVYIFCRTPVLGLGLGVDFTFTWNNNNNTKNPHLNFLKGTVLGAKEQGVGIREKSQGSRDKGQGIRPKWSSTPKTKSCILIYSLFIFLVHLSFTPM